MALGKPAVQIINLTAAVPIMRALQAGLVTCAAKTSFDDEARRHWFFTNPANSVVYAAFAALERDSVVNVYEIIQRELKDMTGESELRRTTELLQHRVAVAHPDRSGWTKPVMQEFRAQRLDLLDIRAALLWDLQRSVNQAAAKFGIASQNSDIVVTMELASSLRLIFASSMKSEFSCALPDASALLKELSDFRIRYLAMLEEHPDGGRAILRQEDANRESA